MEILASFEITATIIIVSPSEAISDFDGICS